MVKCGSLSLLCWFSLGLLICRAIALADNKSDYFETAEYLSDRYQHDGNVKLIHPPNRLLDGAIDPGLRNAVKIAEDGAQQAQRLAGLADRAEAQAMADLKSDTEAAARGDYSHEEQQYAGRIGGQPVYKEVSVDDGMGVVFFSALRYGLIKSKAPEVEASALKMAREGGRIRAWDTLLPDWPDRFAGPQVKAPLLRITYQADLPSAKGSVQRASSGDFPGKYVATNTSGRDLHNVTFAVELFHYSTLPDPILRQVYFVKEWPVGQSLALERIFLVDTKICHKHYFVMATEPPNGGLGLPEVSPQLRGMGGMVRVRSTVWSTEAKQPPMMADLPERQVIVANKLLAYAQEHLCKAGPRLELSDTPISREIQKLQAASNRSNNNGRRQLFSRNNAAKTTPGSATRTPISPAEGLKRYMVQVIGSLPLFLPHDSEQLGRANELLTNPEANRRKSLDERNAMYVAACSPGKSYTTRTWRADPVLHSQASTLEFTSCDAHGQNIHAVAFDPNNPDASRVELTGWLDTAANGQKVIMLRAQGRESIEKASPWNSKPRRTRDQSYCLAIQGGILWFYADAAEVIHNFGRLPAKPLFGFHPVSDDSPETAAAGYATQPAQAPVFLVNPRKNSRPVVVDLLVKLDTKLDVISGKWFISPGHIECQSRPRNSLRFPFTPPEEYDLEMKFTRALGNQVLTVDFPAGGHSLRWAVSAKRNREAGFTEIDGKAVAVGTQRSPRWIKNLQEYTLLIHVRSDKASVLLDGKVISEYVLGAADPSGQHASDGTLQLSFVNSQVSISSMKLTEVQGQGKWNR